MRSHLATHLATVGPDGQAAWLKSFDKALATKVELVVIEVRELADAFLLFETLNDRGLQLSAADLLKSHLLGQIAKKASEEEVEDAATPVGRNAGGPGRQTSTSVAFSGTTSWARCRPSRRTKFSATSSPWLPTSDAVWVLAGPTQGREVYGEFEDPASSSTRPPTCAHRPSDAARHRLLHRTPAGTSLPLRGRLRRVREGG